MYGHVITKFSQMGSLQYFLTHGAPLRALRARELRYRKCGMYHSVSVLDTVNIRHITKLNRRFLHASNLIRDVTALRWDVESTKFDSF